MTWDYQYKGSLERISLFYEFIMLHFQAWNNSFISWWIKPDVAISYLGNKCKMLSLGRGLYSQYQMQFMEGQTEAANRAPGLESRFCLCLWLTEFLTYTFHNVDLVSPSAPLVWCTITSSTRTRSTTFILMRNYLVYCCHISPAHKTTWKSV